MRSFFNKPSWASEGVEDGDSEFYRRAAQTYKDIVATDKSARERRANSVQNSPHKRRRISSSSSTDENTEGLDNGQEMIYEPKSVPGSPPSRGIQRDASHDISPMTLQVSCYNNASFTDLNGSTSSRPPALPRRESSEPRADSISLPPTDTIGNAEADAHENHRPQDLAAPTTADTSCTDRKSAYDQAVVQILITSKIANTKPLMIHRKMSQPLKGVRLAWCTHQNLPKDLHPVIFLTWRDRRLFDVTTCRSLNIDVHSTFAKELSPFGDIFSDTDDFRVHMEAVTEDIYASRNRTSPSNAGNDQTPFKSTEPQDAEQHTLSEIVLKCPGLDDFKIRVTLQTQIFKILAAFREARRVSTKLNVYLAFDGDRLDPQSCLADYEITDGDLVDVLVKKAM